MVRIKTAVVKPNVHPHWTVLSNERFFQMICAELIAIPFITHVVNFHSIPNTHGFLLFSGTHASCMCLLLNDTLPPRALSWAPLSWLLLLKHMRVTSTFQIFMNAPDAVIAAQDTWMCYSSGSFEKLLKCRWKRREVIFSESWKMPTSSFWLEFKIHVPKFTFDTWKAQCW